MKKILSFILVFFLGTTLFASEKFIRMLQIMDRADGGLIVGVYDMEPKFKTTFENKEPKYIILENDLNRKKAEGYVKQLKSYILAGAAYSSVYYAQMTEQTMSDTDLMERSIIPIDYYELIDYIWNRE